MEKLLAVKWKTLTSFKEIVIAPSLIWEPDMEGPLVLGDTAAKVMEKYVPEGKAIYEATYDWYTQYTSGRKTPYAWDEISPRWHEWKRSRKINPDTKMSFEMAYAQEGGDIAFTLAPLLACGVSEEYIRKEAENFHRTPGSEKLINYIKQNNGLIVAITTAWQPVADVIAEKIGIHGAIGTPFPIDQARDLLRLSGKLYEEIAVVHDFLADCAAIIRRGNSKEELMMRIEKFYIGELGISFDAPTRANPDRHVTVLGSMIENIDVVGDRGKAVAALLLGRYNGGGNALVGRIGDGNNDCVFLSRDDAWSFGLNGTKAVRTAQIGVITPDVGFLTDVIETLKQDRTCLPEDLLRNYKTVYPQGALVYLDGDNVFEIIDQAKQEGRPILHLGGSQATVPEPLLAEHGRMKKALREAAGGMAVE